MHHLSLQTIPFAPTVILVPFTETAKKPNWHVQHGEALLMEIACTHTLRVHFLRTWVVAFRAVQYRVAQYTWLALLDERYVPRGLGEGRPRQQVTGPTTGHQQTRRAFNLASCATHTGIPRCPACSVLQTAKSKTTNARFLTMWASGANGVNAVEEKATRHMPPRPEERERERESQGPPSSSRRLLHFQGLPHPTGRILVRNECPAYGCISVAVDEPRRMGVLQRP